MYFDIQSSGNWTSIQEVNKGWSSDKKYKIQTNNNETLLLRISNISEYEKKKQEFYMMKRFELSNNVMSKPLEFGICNKNQNVYMILTWIEGEDLETVLPTLSYEEQYQIGRQAGSILKKFHQIPLDQNIALIHSKKEKKLRQLDAYIQSDVRIKNDSQLIEYIQNNIDYIWQVSPCYLHGDFHPGNLIFTPNKKIGTIDFNRWEIGDPYEEFYKLECFGVESSIPYCIGQIDAYFDNKVPSDFWKAFALYSAHAALYTIKWAQSFGKEEVDKQQHNAYRIIEDFHNFNHIIPKWYKKLK